MIEIVISHITLSKPISTAFYLPVIHFRPLPKKLLILLTLFALHLPIAKEEIAYFFLTNGLVCLVRKDGKQFMVDYTLEELEKRLDPRPFLSLESAVYRYIASIVNIHTYFNGKLKLELQPKIAQEVLVSRQKAQLFKEWVEGN